MDSLELAHTLVEAILEKKGTNILLLDIREQAVFADYFLLCNGANTRQLRAIAETLRQEGKEQTNISAVVEGNPESGWMLVDFQDLLVHIFSEEQRLYYNLEELWDEAHTVLHMP